jgi:dCMP deaminase
MARYSKQPRQFRKKNNASGAITELKLDKTKYEIVEFKLVEKCQRKRPNWQDYFIGLAKLASQRSHDIQTQHGCVVADKNNRILGIGYNGFPRGMNDSVLPNTRPAKYDWMIHSEVNAVNNCIIRPEGAIAYITGEPCNPCIMHLWQNGVGTVVYDNKHGSVLLNEQTRSNRDILIQQTCLKLVPVNADLSWIFGACLS